MFYDDDDDDDEAMIAYTYRPTSLTRREKARKKFLYKKFLYKLKFRSDKVGLLPATVQLRRYLYKILLQPAFASRILSGCHARSFTNG